MSQDHLVAACDRLSHAVDSVQFERLRWARTEGPVLAKLAEFMQAPFAGRHDFELTEEGSTSARKRYIIKVHTNRVAAVWAEVGEGRAAMMTEAIERSRYKVEPGPPISTDYAGVDEDWVSSALSELMGRITA